MKKLRINDNYLGKALIVLDYKIPSTPLSHREKIIGIINN